MAGMTSVSSGSMSKAGRRVLQAQPTTQYIMGAAYQDPGKALQRQPSPPRPPMSLDTYDRELAQYAPEIEIDYSEFGL